MYSSDNTVAAVRNGVRHGEPDARILLTATIGSNNAAVFEVINRAGATQAAALALQEIHGHNFLMADAADNLDLAHKGLGDKYGLVVAQCLLNFPDLEVLNVRDNRFTDESMDQLLSNAIRIRSLRVLNLSENKIDMDSADG